MYHTNQRRSSCVYHLYTDDLLWRNFLSPQCTNHSRDPDHAPFREDFSSAGGTVINQCTKFEVSRFTHYEAMNGGAECRKWCGLGWLGALKVMGNATIRCSAYDFLFNFNRNYMAILFRFLTYIYKLFVKSRQF